MNNEDKQLLNNYLNNTCTREELERVGRLLDLPGTEEYLHTLMMERESQSELLVEENVAEAKIQQWENRLFSRIQAEKENDSIKTKHFTMFHKVTYAAASIALLVLGVYYIYKSANPAVNVEDSYALVEKWNEESLPVQYLLPDQSSVFLGAGAMIRHPRQFNQQSREVTLSGEAFFDVIPDKERPFIVHTRTMLTKVLGTSFKIEAFDNYPLTVSVATGKVSVSTVANEKINKELAVLTPGYKVTYDEASGIHQKGNASTEDLLQWTEGDLIFDQQTLELVALKLEKRYGVQITFEKRDISRYKISGSFKREEDIQTILKILSVIGKFDYKFNHQQSINIY
jgi:transmembrane sensor